MTETRITHTHTHKQGRALSFGNPKALYVTGVRAEKEVASPPPQYTLICRAAPRSAVTYARSSEISM